MSELLNSGQVGLTTLRTLSEQRKEIVKNWDKSGLLEGLQGPKKSTIAQLLENQASHMLNEVTLDSSAGRFDTVAFPMVRRIFSRLLANEIVSVQPLALPSGLIFYMDARVSNNRVAPDKNGSTNVNFGDGSAYERFYDNRGHDASMGVPTAFSGTSVSFSNETVVGGLKEVTLPLGVDFPANAQSSASVKVIAKGGDISYNGAVIAAEGTALKFYSQMQKWGQDQFADKNAKVVIDFRGADNYGTTGTWVASGLTQDAGTTITVAATYNTYASLENNSQMSELTLRFSSVTVNTITRKMRAHWTPELAQDLEAYHSVDAEAELTALLSEEIAAEIDREIIRDLINGAMFEARWDYAGLRNNANFFGTQKDWNQTLVTRINEVSAQIHKATLRGGANWVICSAEAGAIFDDLEYFHVDGSAAAEVEKYNLGIEKIGSLGNRYQVFKDPYLPANIVLVGHKGNTFLEAGYVYSPYIPLQLTQTIFDPETFTPRKGIMTRYAKKMINNRFYGVIMIDNINTYANVYSVA
jgi:hypothetical protein